MLSGIAERVLLANGSLYFAPLKPLATRQPIAPNQSPLQPHRPVDPDRLRGGRGSRPGRLLPVRPRPAGR